MVFVNKISCNFFSFIVVIKNSDNTIGKKSNLFYYFPCFPKVLIFAKRYFCRFAFNKLNLLFV